MKTKQAIIGIILAAFSALSCQAIGLEYVSVDAGMLFIGNSDTRSAPSPFIPCIGASLPLFFEDGSFYVLPRLLLTYTDYLFTGTRPAPAEAENAEHFVLFTILDALAGYRLKISAAIELGFLAGFSLVLRIPVAYTDTLTGETGNYTSYFYGGLRFLYPDTEVSIKWNATTGIGLMFSLKALWPAFHLWDSETLPFYDQLFVSGLLGINISL
jgi:hypothetical protein